MTEDDLKNVDDLKNEDDPKNEDDLKNEDNPEYKHVVKNEDEVDSFLLKSSYSLLFILV